MSEDRNGRTTFAELNSDIKRSSGHAVYILDNPQLVTKYDFGELPVYFIEHLIQDKENGKIYFTPTKQVDESYSPVICWGKDKDSFKEIREILENGNIEVLYQNTDYDIFPIINSSREYIRKAVNDSYRRNNSVSAVMDEFKDIIKSRVNTPSIPTGFKSLDLVLGGGLREGLISLGAETSLGKTTFVMQIADYIAKSGHDVMIFSLEMSQFELISKSLSRITYEHCIAENKPLKLAKTQIGISDGSRYRMYNQDELQLIEKAEKEYKEGTGQYLYIRESVADMTVEQIGKIIQSRYDNTKQLPVVIIDYLQLLQHPDKYINSNDKLRTDVNITSLKRISRDFKIPIIVISSFNRTNYDKDVSLSAFKESGGIEYSSDVIIALKQTSLEYIPNTEISKRMIECSILKNRQGEKGKKVNFEYIPMFNHYKETGTESKKKPTKVY